MNLKSTLWLLVSLIESTFSTRWTWSDLRDKELQFHFPLQGRNARIDDGDLLVSTCYNLGGDRITGEYGYEFRRDPKYAIPTPSQTNIIIKNAPLGDAVVYQTAHSLLGSRDLRFRGNEYYLLRLMFALIERNSNDKTKKFRIRLYGVTTHFTLQTKVNIQNAAGYNKAQDLFFTLKLEKQNELKYKSKYITIAANNALLRFEPVVDQDDYLNGYCLIRFHHCSKYCHDPRQCNRLKGCIYDLKISHCVERIDMEKDCRSNGDNKADCIAAGCKFCCATSTCSMQISGDCMDTECGRLCQEKTKCMENTKPNSCDYDSIGNLCSDKISGCPAAPKLQIAFVVDASVDSAEHTKKVLAAFADLIESITELYGDPEFAVTSFADWERSVIGGTHDDQEGCYKLVQSLTTDSSRIEQADIRYLKTLNYTNGLTALAWTAADTRIGWKRGKIVEDDKGANRQLVRLMILVASHPFNEDFESEQENIPWGDRLVSLLDGINTCQQNKRVTLEFAFDVFAERDVAVIGIFENELDFWEDVEFPFFEKLDAFNSDPLDVLEVINSLVAKKANYNPECFRSCPLTPKLQIAFVVDASIDLNYENQTTWEGFQAALAFTDEIKEVYGDPEFAVTSFSNWGISVFNGLKENVHHNDENGCYTLVQNLTFDIGKVKRANINFLINTDFSNAGTALAWTAADTRIGWSKGNSLESKQNERRPLVRLMILFEHIYFQEDNGTRRNWDSWGNRRDTMLDAGINTCQLNKEATLSVIDDVLTKHNFEVLGLIDDRVIDQWNEQFQFPWFNAVFYSDTMNYNFLNIFHNAVAKKVEYSQECFRSCPPTPKLQIAFLVDASIAINYDNKTTEDAFHAVLNFTDDIKKVYGDPEFAVMSFTGYSRSVWDADIRLHNDDEGCYTLVQNLTLDIQKIKGANINFLPNPFSSNAGTALTWTAADTRIGWSKGDFFESEESEKRPIVRLMILIEHINYFEDNGTRKDWVAWGNRTDTIVDGVNTCQLNKEATLPVIYNVLSELDVVVMGLLDINVFYYWKKFGFPLFRPFHFIDRKHFDFMKHFNALVAEKINCNSNCFQ
ncbi:unnamed protein product [Orchesella dallaii]|uniref:VWFA domain-containing protein n=1 Tax=Orchesella dallaii TaxID=48710 RepID=A0ABP1S9Y4_9HEXA